MTPNQSIRFTRGWFGIPTGSEGAVVEADEHNVTVDVLPALGERAVPVEREIRTMTRAEAARYLEVVS